MVRVVVFCDMNFKSDALHSNILKKNGLHKADQIDQPKTKR